MKLIVDSNILISAFISDSTTRDLMKNIDAEIYAPDKLRDEVNKYDEMIVDKSGLTDRELERLKDRLFKHISLVEQYRDMAEELMRETDPDDVIFVATALAVDAAIWSDDSDLREQDKVKVLTTKDLINQEK